jgi:hypothetical protein
MVELPGTRWAFSLRLEGLTDAERGMMEAWMAKLRGGANRFTCHDLINPRPRGTMRGSLTTVGTTSAGAVFCTLSGGGGQAFTTLVEGDKLTIGGELKVVTSNSMADGSGVIGIYVESPFRSQVAGGASAVWDKPTAQFMPVDSSWRIQYRAPRFGGLSFDAVEVFS